jgi:hypothetical protein
MFIKEWIKLAILRNNWITADLKSKANELAA